MTGASGVGDPQHQTVPIYRGIADVLLPAALHNVVHDPQRPRQERAEALVEHLRPGVGTHWSIDPQIAMNFAGGTKRRPGGDKRVTHVIFHAHANPAEWERDPHELEIGRVLPHQTKGEWEVPIPTGHELGLTGISWRHGAAERWTTHRFGHQWREVTAAHTVMDQSRPTWMPARTVAALDHPDNDYLRFGKWPADERSINHVEGWREHGVSAYDLHRGRPVVPGDEIGYGEGGNDTHEELLGRLRDFRRGQHPAYLVKGTMVGTGHDGEPLLQGIHSVREWQPEPHHLHPAWRVGIDQEDPQGHGYGKTSALAAHTAMGQGQTSTMRPSQLWPALRTLHAPRDQARIDALADSIADHGYRPDWPDLPINAGIHQGTPWIGDGHHRLRAMQQLGYDEPIPVHTAARLRTQDAAEQHNEHYRFGYGHGLIGDPGNTPHLHRRVDKHGPDALDEQDRNYLQGHADGTEERARRISERAESGQHRCPECRGSGQGTWGRHCEACAGSGAISAQDAHRVDTLYHITDKPDFSPDPHHVPEDNALSVSQRASPGLFAATGAGVSTWAGSGHDYVRPYVAELHVPRTAHEPGRWGGERFIPAQHLDKVRVHRIIPLSAHHDEQWEGKPYTGPDAREMSPAQRAVHKQHALDTLRNDRGFAEEDLDHLRQHWAAAGQAYWHVAPSAARESIAAHGLAHEQGDSHFADTAIWTDYPHGNYLFGNRQHAHAYRELREQMDRDEYGEQDAKSYDLWRVHPSGVREPKRDPYHGDASGLGQSSVYTEHPVAPQHLTREAAAHTAGHDWGVFWHGTPSGDLRGGAYGLHVGTQEAARQALHARIGRPADGSDWDGTREYGTTLLAGHGKFGDRTGYNMGPPTGEDHYPDSMPPFSDGTSMSPAHKPDLFPVRITGPMTNTPHTPHPDFHANGYMKAQIGRGRARSGYFYRNVGEDDGSISAVVPHGGHLQRLDRAEQHEAAAHTAAARHPTDPEELTAGHLDDIRAMVHRVRSDECHGGQCGFTSENLARQHGWPMYGGIYHARDGRPIGDHVWNVHEPSGTIIDSTADQFGEGHDVRVLPPTHPDHARYRHADSDEHEEQLLDQARATTAQHGDYWWVPGGMKDPHVRAYTEKERHYRDGEPFKLDAVRKVAADWHEFRRIQDAQQRRYERPGVGGDQEDRDRYFGTGQMLGRGQERLVTPKDWIQHSQGPRLDDLPASAQERWHGYELGHAHGRSGRVNTEELEREHAASPHPDHFSEGYGDGLEHAMGEHERIAVLRSGKGSAPAFVSLMKVAHVSGNTVDALHCFTGDTRFLTREGTRTLEETAGTVVQVLTGVAGEPRGGQWQYAMVHDFGEQPVLSVHLRRNKRSKTVRATPDHDWFTDDGRVRTVKTRELRNGFRLAQLRTSRFIGEPDHEGVRMGVVFGDGHIVRNRATVQGQVTLWGAKRDLAKYFDEVAPGYPRQTPNGVPGISYSRGMPGFSKELPGLHLPQEYLLGWLAGYFAADGEVSRDQGQCSLSCKSMEVLTHVRDVATLLGIGTFMPSTKMRVGYGTEPTPIHVLGFSAADLDDTFFLREDQRARHRTPHHERFAWTVVSVEDLGEVERVYCPRVVGTESFVLEDNILTKNCPFCGSGSVTARSDGSIECSFCTAAYSVQVAPQYSAFPQSINSAPYPWPGRDDMGQSMPGAGGPPGIGADGEEQDGDEEDAPPWMQGDDADVDGEDEDPDEDDEEDEEDAPQASVGGSSGPPPFGKKKSARDPAWYWRQNRRYRTAFGGLVNAEDYLAHLAMVTSTDPDATAARIKAGSA
jgi:hypothetical protein